MRTIAVGLSVGALALFTFIQFDSNANADHDCGGGVPCSNSFVNLTGVAPTIEADEFFNFEDNAQMEWCYNEAQKPSHGAMIINTEETEEGDFNNLDADPDFFSPPHCSGEVATSFSGQLSGDTNPAKLVLRAFCWPPHEFDDEETFVSEPPE